MAWHSMARYSAFGWARHRTPPGLELTKLHDSDRALSPRAAGRTLRCNIAPAVARFSTAGHNGPTAGHNGSQQPGMADTRARSGRTGRFVRPDKRGRVTLDTLTRKDPTYFVAEIPDGTVVLIPAQGWTDADLDLIFRPEVQQLLKPGGGPVLESPTATKAEADTDTLACLAMRQAGLWGNPAFDVELDHPLFDKAVAAARSAGPDEQAAFDAAQTVLEGAHIEARSRDTSPTEVPPAPVTVTPLAAALLKEVSQAWKASGDAEEVTVEAAISPDGHLSVASAPGQRVVLHHLVPLNEDAVARRSRCTVSPQLVARTPVRTRARNSGPPRGGLPPVRDPAQTTRRRIGGRSSLSTQPLGEYVGANRQSAQLAFCAIRSCLRPGRADPRDQTWLGSRRSSR